MKRLVVALDGGLAIDPDFVAPDGLDAVLDLTLAR
jgi:hypothetical protein